MQRLFLSAAILSCASVSAQTTINITLPGTQGSCTYTTGAVLSNSIPGQLQANATSFTGNGCGGGAGGGVSFGPASPLAPALSSLASAGGPASLTFQPVNATQCTGSITPSTGTAFTTAFCNLPGTSCSGLQNVTATFPANTNTLAPAIYSVAVTCSGSGNPATSTASVSVAAAGTVPPGCPSAPTIASSTPGIAANFTQLTGSTAVDYFSGGLQHKDTTSFANIFGTWPGQYGQNVSFTLPFNKYISMAFSVPSNYMTAPNVPVNLYGKYTVGESQYQAPISMTISTSCGDFSPSASTGSTVVSGCSLNRGSSDTALFWAKSGTCALVGGQTYYLNLINANIANVLPNGGGTASSAKTVNCGSTSCLDPLQNGPGLWQGYIPQ